MNEEIIKELRMIQNIMKLILEEIRKVNK